MKMIGRPGPGLQPVDRRLDDVELAEPADLVKKVS